MVTKPKVDKKKSAASKKGWVTRKKNAAKKTNKNLGAELTIKWTEKSISDLEAIFHFYAQESVTAADKVVSEVIEQTESIIYPNQFQQDEFHPKYRRIVVRHFKVLYRVETKVIYIVRIFDTRQNPNKLKL